jgi:amidase
MLYSFGLSFIGRAYSEQRLIELAYSFEQLTQVGLQRKPVILPTPDLCSVSANGKGTLSRMVTLGLGV